ncbi:hypothetical protein [Fusobacterium phage Fnu1]|uniref:Uncharacterized protein n=1 Tax=Fusobacterium phage Fnu1 TaxID=2530024 RepID=A0A481W7B7_9CAUD|nr:hypothetical protein KMD24_gp056 [Fusobacterium phage Fnu1]QBJ04142.1 hypothetical protein [Fusobacterium phage Fnu1]
MSISKTNIQTYDVLGGHFNFKIHSKSRKNHKDLFKILDKFDFTKCNEQYVKNTLEVIEMLFRDGEYLRVSNIYVNYENNINIEFKDVMKTTDLYAVLDITGLSISIADKIIFTYWVSSTDKWAEHKSYEISLEELTKYFTITTSIYGHFRKEI